MPTQKDLKRLIRSRMQKTGESYTTARLRLLQKKKNSPITVVTSTVSPSVPSRPATPRPKQARKSSAADQRATGFAALAGMSDQAVRARTGCDWQRWVYHLDKKGCAEWTHREIAKYICQQFRLSSWWAQTVTVGYERIKGLRDIGQRRGGTYEANKSRTIGVPVERLYRAFSVARMRSRWLPDLRWTLRRATAGKSMRVTCEDGTCIQFNFTAQNDRKSRVTIQHQKLASKSDAENRKNFWDERLSALARLLAPAGKSVV
jgi:hypothetical protein